MNFLKNKENFIKLQKKTDNLKEKIIKVLKTIKSLEFLGFKHPSQQGLRDAVLFVHTCYHLLF